MERRKACFSSLQYMASRVSDVLAHALSVPVRVQPWRADVWARRCLMSIRLSLIDRGAVSAALWRVRAGETCAHFFSRWCRTVKRTTANPTAM